MSKPNLKQFINFWNLFYNDSNSLDDKMYYPYINDLSKNDFLDNLWSWKMQVHFKSKSNQNKLRKMKEDENKRIIINFRDGKPSFDELFNFSGKIFKNGIIYRIFLMHICRPTEYPIFDQHVFRAFIFLTTKNIPKELQTIEDYKDYRDFVFKIHEQYKISLRNIDKGLMAFGQFLADPQKFFKINDLYSKNLICKNKKNKVNSKNLKKYKKVIQNKKQIFWKQFLKRAHSEKSPYFNESHNINNRPDFICEKFGVHNISICLIATQNNARIEIFINSGNEEKNKEIFTFFKKYKDKIEGIFGDKLRWRDHGINGKIMKSRIIDYEYSGVNIDDKDDWDKIINFFLDGVKKIDKSFSKPKEKLSEML